MELVPEGQAEPEHQDYLERVPNGYTRHFVRAKLPANANEEHRQGPGIADSARFWPIPDIGALATLAKWSEADVQRTCSFRV
jgi:hypothetical protein